MRSINPSFYKSKAWRSVRLNVWRKQYCLCNRCKRPVYVRGLSEEIPKEKQLKGIVHHIEHLNNSNINNDEITLSEDNLEGVCIECHNSIHFESTATRESYLFDENGNFIKK